jgi:hypothetical protein
MFGLSLAYPWRKMSATVYAIQYESYGS